MSNIVGRTQIIKLTPELLGFVEGFILSEMKIGRAITGYTVLSAIEAFNAGEDPFVYCNDQRPLATKYIPEIEAKNIDQNFTDGKITKLIENDRRFTVDDLANFFAFLKDNGIEFE